MIKIAYFGTSLPSARVLETLANTEGFRVVAVVTQSAKPVGRDQTVQASPVKVTAEKLRIPVYEPASLKTDQSLVSSLQSLNIDLFIVFAYGLIIPQAILDIPSHGSINIHPSLLPKYRGPTPVQSALLNGETETGVSIMLLDAKMDHPPLPAQTKMKIEQADTTPTLTDKLITDAIPLLITTVNNWIAGNIKPTEQDHEAATICKMLSRDDGKIDWKKSADEIYNMYRAYTPWPGVWTLWGGKRMKLLKIKRLKDYKIEPGKIEVKEVKIDKIYVGTTTEAIEIVELQLEGKQALDAKTFINGYKNFTGAKLGT